MREWSREERYRVLQSADEIRDLHDRISNLPLDRRIMYSL